MTRTLFLASALALACSHGAPLQAADSTRSGDHRDRTSGLGLSALVTTSVSDQLRIDLAYCDRITAVYSFDCTAYALSRAATDLKGNPAYTAPESILRSAARTIRATVKAEIDRARLPRLNGLQYYRPVQPSATPALRQHTAATLDQTAAAIAATPQATAFDPITQAILTGRQTPL
ncbi:hypothetical protein [Marinibacterium profundimaris]|uniref:UrcA family protein n=1 Tax=Marinibacterium profundimaris TaxID=1679460 RepID=A0A225NM20_9RHOB|nr:hypothetical protein [Marinibacterium profundimaris]OWU73249.1 hypothetical protein ATO3_11125 [Marinibacterium profundimaris]